MNFSFLTLLLTVTCMWSGGPEYSRTVRPAGKWAKGLTCQTAKTPACHIQFVGNSYFFIWYLYNFSDKIDMNCILSVFDNLVKLDMSKLKPRSVEIFSKSTIVFK